MRHSKKRPKVPVDWVGLIVMACLAYLAIMAILYAYVWKCP